MHNFKISIKKYYVKDVKHPFVKGKPFTFKLRKQRVRKTAEEKNFEQLLFSEKQIVSRPFNMISFEPIFFSFEPIRMPFKSNSGVMICDTCHYPITSEKHHSSCVNIEMWQIKEQRFEATTPFKPMMTYGLGGCTAIIIVLFDKMSNEPVNVIFGHHPCKNYAFSWFTEHYSTEYNIVTIIKTPGEYVQIDSKWIMEATEKLYWEEKIIRANSKLILEPYSLNMSHDRCNFKTSLYCKFTDSLQYSDEYGRFIPIKY
jgi:hypothetical protein